MSVGENRYIVGKHYASGQIVQIRILNGLIVEMDAIPNQLEYGESLPWVGPGLVDIHINGCFGIDVNEEQPQIETLKRMSRALWKEGVTSFCPTIITNSSENNYRLLRTIAQACEEDAVANEAMMCIHMEGPFISPEDGARGAHPLQHVIAPDWTLFQHWQEASGGRIKLITISPEWPGSIAFIERCVKSGVVVSIGHTSANSQQILDAIAAGASLSTHLGNGAHLSLPRHPNYIWEQLANDNLSACVIADGFHLPLSFLHVVRKVKREKLILVSDAVLYSGMKAGEYDNPVMGDIVLTPEGRLHLKQNDQLLAGSAQMLPHCIAHMVKHHICSLSEAWESASIEPSRLIGWSTSQGLSIGAPADLVLFQWAEDRLEIEATFKNGIKVF
ncbi:N-acetylglucosamine-6-phosphate deacetylase [Paenibacillus sp. GCM10027628]|uniref:N-acetylglucosamine-6-phosphate deacetylase n=1 Tax=Paenibacillus sp. GCM10027628 TaxID=3273413 RepID=UPI003644D713